MQIRTCLLSLTYGLLFSQLLAPHLQQPSKFYALLRQLTTDIPVLVAHCQRRETFCYQRLEYHGGDHARYLIPYICYF